VQIDDLNILTADHQIAIPSATVRMRRWVGR